MIFVNKHFSRNYNEILAQGYRFAKHDANTYYLTIGSQYNFSSYKLNLNKTLEIIYPWANNGRDISHLNPLFEKVRAEHKGSLTHLYEYILRTIRYYVPGQNEVKRELKNIPHFTNYYKELIKSYDTFITTSSFGYLPILYCGLVHLNNQDEYPTQFVVEFLNSNFVQKVRTWDFENTASYLEPRGEYNTTWLREISQLIITLISEMHQDIIGSLIVATTKPEYIGEYKQVEYLVSIPEFNSKVEVS